MYAIVRTGGRQQKVSEGDVIEVDRLSDKKAGDSVELSTVLIVDGDAVTSDPWVLAGVKVQAEVLDHYKGEKIRIQKYKNKTGYKKRIGHRQLHTQLKITGVPAPAAK